MSESIVWQDWLEGDVYAPRQWPVARKQEWRKLREALARAARRRYRQTKVKRKIYIQSGCRTRAEQQKLWDAYRNGTGNPANPPGTSDHEFGRAADITVFGNSLLWERAFKYWGICTPHSHEPWHKELVVNQ